MKRRSWAIPTAITALVVLVVSAVELLPLIAPGFAGIRRLEWLTYDWRLQMAASRVSSEQIAASPFGFVLIDEDSIRLINDGSFPFRYGLYWPRLLHGYVAAELSAEGAEAAAFDVLFAEERPDHARTALADGSFADSDAFFAESLNRSRIGILASTDGVMPARIFQRDSVVTGDITANPDADGVLRRVKPFQDYARIWHPVIRNWAVIDGANLDQARLEAGWLVIPHVNGTNNLVARLNAKGEFYPDEPPQILPTNGSAQLSHVSSNRLEETSLTVAKPFESRRIWHMGILLAARRLGLDLQNAEIRSHELILPGTNGASRILPLDDNGNLLIRWQASLEGNALFSEPFYQIVAKLLTREDGEIPENSWTNRLAIIGSKATGNDLTDRGATPLTKHDFLVGKHWNIANMVLNDSFIRVAGTGTSLFLIALMAALSAWVTWNLKAIHSSLSILAIVAVYVLLAAWLFLQWGWWVPIFLPLCGGLLANHVALVTYRVRLEQNEKRRVTSVFSKIVSPNVVNELLTAEKIFLGGTRRQITVYFADVRGFTAFMDSRERETETYIRENNLTGQAADTYRDEQADRNLRTINRYLATIADVVKHHDGTLDKYMGDCVMAFWGAPAKQHDHALRAVKAAISAQRSLEALNEVSREENIQRDQENKERAAKGLPPLGKLPEISLGTGINTGFVTVGLMGSDAHILNYTVFGGDVNLASRLEGFSGRGRIIIGEATLKELERDDSALAATCVAVEVQGLKGFSGGIKAYEVPWRVSKPSA